MKDSFSQLLVEETRKRGETCTFALVLPTLDDEVRAELLDALGNPAVAHAPLARALSKLLGKKVSDSTVARHRRHECDCSR